MNERELFNQWFKLKFPDLHESICWGDLVAKKYKKAMFEAWKAPDNRAGYKLVPVDVLEALVTYVAQYAIESDIDDLHKAVELTP